MRGSSRDRRFSKLTSASSRADAAAAAPVPDRECSRELAGGVDGGPSGGGLECVEEGERGAVADSCVVSAGRQVQSNATSSTLSLGPLAFRKAHSCGHVRSSRIALAVSCSCWLVVFCLLCGLAPEAGCWTWGTGVWEGGLLPGDAVLLPPTFCTSEWRTPRAS